MLVPIPIGAFSLAFLGDVLHVARPSDRFWYDFSYACIGFGIAFAALAAVAGAIDYVNVEMGARAFRTATKHLLLNLSVVVLYVLSLLARRNGPEMAHGRWVFALGAGLVGFVLLAMSGWIVGKFTYEHRIGVIPEGEAALAETHRSRAVS